MSVHWDLPHFGISIRSREKVVAGVQECDYTTLKFQRS